MASAIPAQLKGLKLAPFAKRAAQLERFKPIVAYWLRFYIVQRILAAGLHAADAACTAYTTGLVEQLEQAKVDRPADDALLDEAAARAHCEHFALQTFAKGEREMAEARATSNTADTLQAASTFLELLSLWKQDAEPETASKIKYAKFHAWRILKAIKAGQDPNLTAPVQETQEASEALEAVEPSVASPQVSYQPPRVESAQPSPPTGFAPSPHDHGDVSPISPPVSPRRASLASTGEGCFPRTHPEPPTFTAETLASGLPTAPSMNVDPLMLPLPSSPQPLPASAAPDPASFYQQPSPPSLMNQPQGPPLPPHNPYHSPPSTVFSPQPQGSLDQAPYQQSPGVSLGSTVAESQHDHSPSVLPQPLQKFQQPQGVSVDLFPPSGLAPSPSPSYQNSRAPLSTSPARKLLQGPFRSDEDSILEAQKHAKWAISALNFEDAETAVKELQIALHALGAY